MSAHTIGHWHVEDPLGDDAGDALWIVADGATPEVYDWRCIAIVTSDNPDETDNPLPMGVAERDANARLIAAAPDLLAALQSMIPSNVALGNDAWPDSTVVPIDFTLGELRAARAAIASATGEVEHG